jgi:hypothetical protein
MALTVPAVGGACDMDQYRFDRSVIVYTVYTIASAWPSTTIDR